MSEPRVITMDEVAAVYIKTRNDISNLTKKIEDLKALQKRREEWMLNYLAKAKLQNAKTEHGTVYQLKKESVTVSDWDTFYAWVKANHREDMISHAAAKTVVVDYMGKDRETPAPPGLSYVVVRTVGVKK